GLAAHDGRERAVGHLLGFVQRRVVQYGVDEVDVFLHVRAHVLPFVAPHRAAFGLNVPAGIGSALSALDALTNGGPFALNLAAIAVHPRAAGGFIFHGAVIPNLPRPAVPLLSRAHARALGEVIAHDPVADVKVVDVLFANMVPAEPDVVVPVANLPFEFSAALERQIRNWYHYIWL